MQLFDLAGAKAFASGFSAGSGKAAGSMQDFLSSIKGQTKLVEGQTEFSDYRDCLLREAERRLYLATSNYRRAHDLMLGSAAHWTHVTLYYSAFYAASSIVGMLGGWIGDWNLVHVNKTAPGSQELSVVGKPGLGKLTTYPGKSHRMFWDIYYNSMPPLATWIPGKLTPAITAINGDPLWLIQLRNDVNYRSLNATAAVIAFQNSFDPSRFPTCLHGDIATLFRLTGEAVELGSWLADEIQLSTDALQQVQPAGTRRVKFLAAISATAANLPTAPILSRVGL